MLKLVTILLALAPAAVFPQDDEPELPDPKVVEAALEELAEGLREEEPEARAQAIERAASVEHPDVIAEIADAFDDESDAVRRGVLEALRYMAHEDALEALRRKYRKGKKLRKQPELMALLLRAIAQHRDPESVDILNDNPFSIADREVVRARILGLGYVHSERSVPELMALMRSAKHRDVQRHMEDFRLSLMSLTGVDLGTSQDRWNSWWNDNKREFELAEASHKLPKDDQYRWDRYWGHDRMRARGQKREDRGDDPEDG